MEENNKLIAEFMGYESYEYSGYRMFVLEENNHRTDIDLHYHTSWDWLMPVVEKIEGMNIEIGGITTSPDVIIVYGDCTIQDENDKKLFNFYHHSIDSKDKLGATYKAVVEFINDYNKIK